MEEEKIIQSSIDENESINEDKPADTELLPKRVGGWLLLFIISLVIITPIINISSIIKSIQTINSLSFEAMGSGFNTEIAQARLYLILETVISCMLILFGMFAGICLWRTTKNAVKITKYYLLCILIKITLSMILFYAFGLHNAPYMQGSVMSIMVPMVLQPLIYFTIWYSYLCKSERVKATYNSEE